MLQAQALGILWRNIRSNYCYLDIPQRAKIRPSNSEKLDRSDDKDSFYGQNSIKKILTKQARVNIRLNGTQKRPLLPVMPSLFANMIMESLAVVCAMEKCH